MGILGGKNGQLKCKCGKLRYPNQELCPSCYYSNMKYYVANIYMEESEITHEPYWYILRGINIHNAMTRKGLIERTSNDGYHYVLYIPKEYYEFTTKREAEEFYNQKIKENIMKFNYTKEIKK